MFADHPMPVVVDHAPTEFAIYCGDGTPPTPPAVYAPGAIRRSTDRQRVALEAFVAKYPQYAKLPPDVLAQYAVTYRDDKDHALEQEYRDNGVLTGCRVDHRHGEPDWDEVHTSDNAFSEEGQS